MLSNKRLLKEISSLVHQQSSKNLLENDYLIYFDDSNVNEVHALIKAPRDSLYRHKFVRLDLKIPENYPHSPPDVTFVNYDGVRIHPNMYENGKCCATILNTWGDDKFEKWTSSMGIETILLTFHSFLDNNPYCYEPGGQDDPSYTIYVLYQSWYTCLLRYLEYERIPLFSQMISNYLLLNIGDIFYDLGILNSMYPYGSYRCRCFEIDDFIIDYSRIVYILQSYYDYLEYQDSLSQSTSLTSYKEWSERIVDYKCNICFDCGDDTESLTVLPCTHSFHKECLKQHVENNTSLCPMCRTEFSNVSLEDVILKDINWVINPLTNRKVKVGGKTYLYLVNNNIMGLRAHTTQE